MKSGLTAGAVMPGLVPGIHVLRRSPRKTWMAGTSPDKPGHDEKAVVFMLIVNT
jgi:hypothetical protein